MNLPHRRSLCTRPVMLACGAVLAAGGVAACGSSHATSGVASVRSDVTAQMLAAASAPSSHPAEASFPLTARTASGKPAAGAPVHFWVGPMTPRSGVPPAHWYETGSAAARRYVASASATTDAAGVAEIHLYGEPAKSMEMVAVRVGGLNSFDAGAGHGVGLLDAWWTTPSTSPTAPIGDRVTVSPFLTAATGRQSFTVHVARGGASVSGAGVQFIDQGSGHAMASSSAPTQRTTDHAGDAVGDLSGSSSGGPHGLRVVVTEPGSATRFSGAMAAQAGSAAR